MVKKGHGDDLPVALYQLCMILNCLLNSLLLDADIALRGGGDRHGPVCRC